MGKTFNYERAEQEANKIGLEFAHSTDVVKDMSRAYNVDFSNIRVHTDSAADNKVKAAGKDALAQGNDIFFGKGIFESSDPVDKGLVAHEFAHTMQQGAAMGGEMAVAESAPMGAAQGGLGSWFKRHFTHKGRVAARAAKTPMADLNSAVGNAFAGEGEAPQMAPNARKGQTVSHEEFQHQKNAEALRNVFVAMQNPVPFQEVHPERFPAPAWEPEEDLFSQYSSEEIMRMENFFGTSITNNPYRFRKPR